MLASRSLQGTHFTLTRRVADCKVLFWANTRKHKICYRTAVVIGCSAARL